MRYRVDWWLGRMQSPEYQRAYDTISKTVSARDSDIFVEIGCGPGEMLRRIRKGSVIGTDITLRMLQIAQRNLKSHGIEPLVYSSPSEISALERGVSSSASLVLDNYLRSGLPSSFVDKVLITFPEISGEGLMEFLYGKFGATNMQTVAKGAIQSNSMPSARLRHDHYQTITPAEILAVQIRYNTSLVRDKEVHRILKNSGEYTIVDYDSTDKPENFSAQTKLLLKISGFDKYFELLQTKFVIDPFISADATLAADYDDKGHVLKGYGISTYRKI